MRVRGYAPATPCFAELVSNDPEPAADFYRELFGWQATTTDAGTTVFTVGGLAVAGLARARRRSAWRTHISIQDIDDTVAAVLAAGGSVLKPPAEVGTRGRTALVTDAEGAAFSLWQPGTFAGAQLLNEPSAMCWSEVATRDPATAISFYRKVFGWSDQPGEMPTSFQYRDWQVENRVVGGLIPMGAEFPAEVPPHWRTTIEVDVCAETADRCTALGGHVFLGPVDIGIGQFAQLFDPQGGAVGVIEPIPAYRLTW